MRLNGKVAIVTGAAQGIGAAYASGLASEGAKVWICDVLDPQSTVDQITAAGGTARGSITDITSKEGIASMTTAAIEAFGSIDILVNNAAMFATLRMRPFYEIEAEEWDRVMTVNVRGTVDCVRAALPHMRKNKYGKIINISSATVHRGTPMLMHYVASKGAIIAVTRSMARELGEFGIRVNCIAPGFTLSEGVRSNTSFVSPTQAAMTIASRALKREQIPGDLVGTVCYLASSDSDFVTGQTIVVDGGVNMI